MMGVTTTLHHQAEFVVHFRAGPSVFSEIDLFSIPMIATIEARRPRGLEISSMGLSAVSEKLVSCDR